MSKLNGGYVMIDLNDTDNIYTKAKKAVGSGKPVMVFDDPDVYYADSISLNGDGDVVIIKGGKTININDANAVISEGTVSNPTMENIKDLAGNLRFVGDDFEVTLESGWESEYAKWSLSGTHLMVVVAISGTNNAVHDGGTIATIGVSDYILDKIVAGYTSVIERKQLIMYASNGTSQSVNIEINKDVNGLFVYMSSLTLTADRYGRIQFDLLIDAD